LVITPGIGEEIGAGNFGGEGLVTFLGGLTEGRCGVITHIGFNGLVDFSPGSEFSGNTLGLGNFSGDFYRIWGKPLGWDLRKGLISLGGIFEPKV